MQTQDKDKTKKQIQEKPKITVNKIPVWPVGIYLANSEKLSVSVAEDLAVVFTKDAFEQLFGWAYSTSKEISCLGSVHREGNRFFVDKFYLLKQSGCSASTELDQDAIAELMEQLIAQGKTDEAGCIKCWAHSHPNMEAFWSNIDDATCRLLVNDYLISLVVGNNFAIRCRIDISSPVSVVFDNIPVLYRIPEDNLALASYAEEVRSTVSEKVFSFTSANKEKEQEDRFIPASYCDLCGYCHPAGECPLDDPDRWPVNFNEDEFMF